MRMWKSAVWLAVMGRAMVDTGVSEKERTEIMATFRRAALMLVNVD
jgi:hemoglobin